MVETNVLGMFTGICVVTQSSPVGYLCTYEIYFNSNGIYSSLAGIIVNGAVNGPTADCVVTGAEYDFEDYSTGTLTTLEDPALPLLYAYLANVGRRL